MQTNSLLTKCRTLICSTTFLSNESVAGWALKLITLSICRSNTLTSQMSIVHITRNTMNRVENRSGHILFRHSCSIIRPFLVVSLSMHSKYIRLFILLFLHHHIFQYFFHTTKMRWIMRRWNRRCWVKIFRNRLLKSYGRYEFSYALNKHIWKKRGKLRAKLSAFWNMITLRDNRWRSQYLLAMKKQIIAI